MIFMRVENYNNNYFIETPDINVINSCLSNINLYGEDYSFECNNSFECFYCMFIDKTTIVHNDDTYSNTLFLGGRSHMPLDKPPEYIFKILIANSKAMVPQIPIVWKCLLRL
ncbi:hypothetical protein H8356DRAFT_1364182 [Neocallimastix lanati (nom. inval.)]|nr:hypothetical protein H8356DRAFT_1364182 [Neocallimastix sp. JGI-2020a]